MRQTAHSPGTTDRVLASLVGGASGALRGCVASDRCGSRCELAEALRAAGPILASLIRRPPASAGPDLTAGQFRLLDLLATHGPCTLDRLAANLGTDTSEIAARSEYLSQTNLIRRAPSPADGRAVRIALTDSGRALVEHALEADRTQIHTALAQVTAGDRRVILRALRRLATVHIAVR
jgi:DNA-binding MarR family transcriptional regulator